MKRVTYTISDLDCMVCATKLETKLNKISGVHNASVHYFLKQCTFEAEEMDIDAIENQLRKVVDRVLPGATITKS